METAELDTALEELELRLERLRALYEQYFLGLEKIEPSVARKDVDRRIYVLRREKIRNTAKRFKLQTIIQRYNTFQQYWQRICREIENGTYKRHLLRAQKANGELLTIAARRRLGRAARMSGDADAAPGSQPPSAPPEAAAPVAPAPVAPAPIAAAPAPFSPAPVPAAAASAPKPAPAKPAPPKFESLDLDMDFMGDWDPSARTPAAAKPSTLAKPAVPAAPAKPFTPAKPAAPVLPAPAAPVPARPASISPQPVAVPPRPASSRPPLAPTRPLASPRIPPSPRVPPAAAAPAARPAPPPKPVPSPKPAPPLGAGPKPAAPLGAAPKPAAPLGAAPKPAAPAATAPKPVAAAAPARPAAATATAAVSGGFDDARLRDLHSRLQQAKQQTKEANVSFEGLAKSIRATEAKLREQHKNRKIDFDVVIKDGKAVVKPIVK